MAEPVTCIDWRVPASGIVAQESALRSRFLPPGGQQAARSLEGFGACVRRTKLESDMIGQVTVEGEARHLALSISRMPRINLLKSINNSFIVMVIGWESGVWVLVNCPAFSVRLI